LEFEIKILVRIDGENKGTIFIYRLTLAIKDIVTNSTTGIGTV
jgi:hypothetical protein